MPHATDYRIPVVLAWLAPALLRFIREQAQDFRRHADQLMLTCEAHVKHTGAAAEDLAWLV